MEGVQSISSLIIVLISLHIIYYGSNIIHWSQMKVSYFVIRHNWLKLIIVWWRKILYISSVCYYKASHLIVLNILYINIIILLHNYLSCKHRLLFGFVCFWLKLRNVKQLTSIIFRRRTNISPSEADLCCDPEPVTIIVFK